MTAITCVTTRYLPNLRHLVRLCETDKIVILDIAPLPNRNRDSFVNRNRIVHVTSQEERWLSVPVLRERNQQVRLVKIDPTNHRWIDKHIGTISHCYPKNAEIAPNFITSLTEVLKRNNGSLLDVNMSLIELIFNTLSVDVGKPVLQSEIVDQHDNLHRLKAAIALNATQYIAGQVEWDIMKESGEIEKFSTAGIEVVRSPNIPPELFNHSMVTRYSCINSICRHGVDYTRNALNLMVDMLRKEKEVLADYHKTIQ